MAEPSAAKAAGRADVEDLQHDLEDLRKTIQSLAKDLSDIATDATSRAGAKASAKVSELGERAAARGEQATHAAQSYIRDNPVQSVLIAFGIGMLIARVTSRR